jgi:hypothetical protein
MSTMNRHAIEEMLRRDRMSELSAEIYAALKAAEPLLKYRDSFLHGQVMTLIAKIEGWPK